MNSSTAARLVELNREFYDKFGEAFSATRHRIQPGVRRIMQKFKGDESILDLGCGNGEFARELARAGHRGPYLGLDFSVPLLRNADSQPDGFTANFIQVDLTDPMSLRGALVAFATKQSEAKRGLLRREEHPPRNPLSGGNDVVTSFAVLHHIPSREMRLNILGFVYEMMKADGIFILSNWQFLNSEKLKARIRPWEVVLGEVERADLDAGDYLLDWRSGGEGLRYVHHFSEDELSGLAREIGFKIVESFYSDGENPSGEQGGRLGLYQVWKK